MTSPRSLTTLGRTRQPTPRTRWNRLPRTSTSPRCAPKLIGELGLGGCGTGLRQTRLPSALSSQVTSRSCRRRLRSPPIALGRRQSATPQNMPAHMDGIAVRMTRTDSGLTIEIEDDGIGVATGSNPSGVGLASMTERATELGGWCRNEVSPSGGTRVTAWLPIMIDR